MASVQVESEFGEVDIVLRMSSDEVKLAISTWDIPIELKHSLLKAKNKAVELIEEQAID